MLNILPKGSTDELGEPPAGAGAVVNQRVQPTKGLFTGNRGQVRLRRFHASFFEGDAMKHCPKCLSEYRETATECSDCPGQLLTKGPPPKPPATPQSHQDTRRFVPVATTENPLEAEQFEAALAAKSIASFVRSRKSSSVDMLTVPAPPWWEVLVAEDEQVRAKALLEELSAELRRNQDEAIRAAEEEEAETETETLK